MPGDDYIFYSHPNAQLIPRDDMLRQWYLDMLEKAKQQGVVLKVNTLYDEYFKNNGKDSTLGSAVDPTSLPYFEGDYIPGEIENIIKDLGDQGDVKKKESSSKTSKVGKKKGTRSNPGELIELRQDKVMLRLGQAMINMKQNFMVVHLRSRRFAAAVERGEDVSEWIDDEEEDQLRTKKTKIGGKDSGILFPDAESSKDGDEKSKTLNEQGQNSSAEAKNYKAQSGAPDKRLTESPGQTDGDNQQKDSNGADSGKVDGMSSEKNLEENATGKSGGGDNDSLGTVSVSITPPPEDETEDPSKAFGADDDPKKTFDDEMDADGEVKSGNSHGPLEGGNVENKTSGNDTKGSSETAVVTVDSVPGGQDKNLDKMKTVESKRGFDEMKPAISRHIESTKRSLQVVGNTVDEDEPQETETFESRQQFLNYCQANHFQFDELRRAKHTTMMILFQLHNPNAPKFLQQCGSCYREITHGLRYHCNVCSNFDLCQDCYEPVITGLWAQRDSRFAHDKSHSFTPIDMEASADTQKGREERARAIKIHLELLAHAGSCEGAPTCTSKNCEKMKNLFKHVQTCEITFKKGCKVCARLLSLITMHARLCTVRGECPIPFCDRIRERNRRLRQQQQLMDDRRRQAQNDLYRAQGS